MDGVPKNKLQLSILDIATIQKGNTVAQTLRESTELAQLADSLGYTRYWFAEHHNTVNQASTSPDLMSAHVAAHTKRIRIGSGGIMLPNHSPLKVVENFSLLEALHPGRIDLGIGRAPGTDGMTAYALRRSREAVTGYDFPQQLSEMLSFFSQSFPSDHPFSRITPTADKSLIPDLFMLGSSDGGMQFAAENGLGFAFAGHISPHLAVPMLQAYQRNFKPSIYLNKPKSILSIIVITAETEEEAHYLAGPVELYWTRLYTGSRIFSFATAEEAKDYVYSPTEEAARQQNKSRFIIGDVKTVAEKLRELAKTAMVDEIMLVEFYPEKAARLKGYQLLAKELELEEN